MQLQVMYPDMQMLKLNLKYAVRECPDMPAAGKLKICSN